MTGDVISPYITPYASFLLRYLDTDTSVSHFPLLFRLSSILVSHFMLDLQEAHQRRTIVHTSNGFIESSRSIASTLDFAPALGSLAAHIDTPNLGAPDCGGVHSCGTIVDMEAHMVIMS